MAERILNYGEAICVRCGAKYRKNSGSQKYCQECRKILRSQSRVKAASIYAANHYDRLNIRVKKGYRSVITDHAEAMGDSLNNFICRAIDNQIIRDLAEKHKNK